MYDMHRRHLWGSRAAPPGVAWFGVSTVKWSLFFSLLTWQCVHNIWVSSDARHADGASSGLLRRITMTSKPRPSQIPLNALLNAETGKAYAPYTDFYIFLHIFTYFWVFLWVSSFYAYFGCFWRFHWDEHVKRLPYVEISRRFDHWNVISWPFLIFLISFVLITREAPWPAGWNVRSQAL